ncbi:unnamed protein product [Callosobruchus maculatus]|uniref:C2H2-type domain-containing protein n=1 Tax=Callosobruchus maculatus TaxID=64391 RepID=A0A653CZZ2_CALMS|nr:unnamed protein product [Callosobruchus maculatus]
MHPHLIASVSRKIYECTHCTYKTIMKHHLTRHMSQHYKTADSHKLRCVQCDAVFTSKQTRDEHIVRKHPNSVASVSSKIHQCAYCTYQTIIMANFTRHMLKHPETANGYKFITCIHCNSIYKRKINLDNHILKQHSEYMASIFRKIHECTKCSYKTVIKTNLARHMSKHRETADSCKFSTCVHCNATFKCKVSLGDHMVRKHPDFIGSISFKIYECMHCTYKTRRRGNFARHALKHL